MGFKMTIIFEAKTQEGYTIKILSELLQNTIKTACLEISKEGIKLRMMDSRWHILIDIILYSHKFNIYNLNINKTMYLGINLNHLYKMLKSIKKKDALKLHIEHDKPDQLFLTVYPKDRNGISFLSVHIQTIQHINIPLPVGYNPPIHVQSCDYQRAIKDMNNIENVITINMKKYSLTFSCSADNIFSSKVLFGEIEDDSAEYYCKKFDIEHFIRILKIAGLSKTLEIYGSYENIPLLINSNVGNLGTISIFIKTKDQIRSESEL